MMCERSVIHIPGGVLFSLLPIDITTVLIACIFSVYPCWIALKKGPLTFHIQVWENPKLAPQATILNFGYYIYISFMNWEPKTCLTPIGVHSMRLCVPDLRYYQAPTAAHCYCK